MKMTVLLLVGALEVYAGGDIAVMDPVYHAPLQSIEVHADKMFYAYVMAGSALHSIKNTENIIFSKGALDDQATIIEIGFGYTISPRTFIELAYQRKSFEQNDIDNFYVSANYIYVENEYKPYIGALAGYSRLDWTKDPTAVFQSFEDSSTSYLLGAQTGIEVPLTEALSFAAKYQFTMHDHVLDVRNVSEAIVNENSHNLFGGIKYEF